MNKRVKGVIESILKWGLGAFVILAIISVIAILGGALMRLFGFEYDSAGSVILYFIIVTIIGAPIDILCQAFPRALVSLGKIQSKAGIILFIVIDTIGTSVVMASVDYFMESVSATDLSIGVISFITAILSLEQKGFYL